MARTPDRISGPSVEEKVIFDNEDAAGDPTVDPTEVGGMVRRESDDSFRMRDSQGVLNPRQASVSNNDTTSGFLKDKLTAGTGVSIIEQDDGDNESLEISATAGGGVQEIPFSGVVMVAVDHDRSQMPLVQVVIVEQQGWNANGWNNIPWNQGQNVHTRLPDDQYVTRHESDNKFVVKFSSPKTGKVLYF